MPAMMGLGGLETVRLGVDDVPEISALLGAVWPNLYGKRGCPVFDEGFLRWVFGGDGAERNYLSGFRLNGELVAFQSFLHRELTGHGGRYHGHINTHVTILPSLPWGLRCACSAEMLRQHVLFARLVPECDVVISYHESDSTLRREGDLLLRKCCGVQRDVYCGFSQALLLPGTMMKRIDRGAGTGAAPEVRRAVPADVEAMAVVFNRDGGTEGLSVTMSAEGLRHCFFGAPEHATFVAENNGGMCALLHCYPMGVIRRGTRIDYLIIEFLAMRSPDALVAGLLLRSAVEYAAQVGARGVVMENATYLDAELCRSLGLAASLRRMTMSALFKDQRPRRSESFRCDVK